MGNGFKKFQRKIRIGSVIRAILFGLSLGVITSAVLMLIDKLSMRDADIVRYIIVSLIPTALGIGIMLPILVPTQKRLAKRIDASLGLGEKVQTMVEFKNETGTMAQMQREDADRILRDTPKHKVKGMCTWVFTVIPLLAVLCMVGTVLVPAKAPEEEKPPVDETFSLSPWQEQALKNLIDEVKSSEMEETPRDSIVKQLEGLLIRVKSIKKESAMKETVAECIVKIDEIVEENNTYGISAEILADSIDAGLSTLGNSMKSGEMLLVIDALHETAARLDENKEEAEVIKLALDQALVKIGNKSDEALTSALGSFSLRLGEINDETDAQSLTLMMVNVEGDIVSALRPEITNEEIGEKTIYRLMDIFKLKNEDIPEGVFDKESSEGSSDAESDERDEEETEKGDGGGLGSGDREVAANDEIYDHDSLDYKKYAELIDEYSVAIAALETDGKIDPEIAKLIKDYIALLNRP